MNEPLRLKLPYIVLTLLYCAGIYWMSSRSKLPDTPDFIPFKDKIAHAVIYAGLAAVVSVGIRRSNESVRPREQFLLPLLFAALYGLSDEIHQYFVPDRTCDVWDWLVDCLGAAAMQYLLCAKVWAGKSQHNE